ncbi:type II asparaginase [Runella slithyformis]|uniref:L-asparaginase, type II n=1 Tax=Runella slithyformis (strain ATCC 29530 / DSM 19594 / LMG 11500 / NCIMB 11436 / LSU 4) TaxID=761193 RepID=A0A7U3ZL29_RUNSL|nr:type II asparaginase [Runella slithyformis]AEI49178.1 L-asparaginase, type II [Runella slithyformis DSM 19594]
MKNVFFLLLAACLLPIGAGAQKPRVIVLATGGTIAGKGASPDRAAYEAGKIPIQELLVAIPSINTLVDVQGEQIASVGSYKITIDIWLKLAKRINEITANNEADGIVITHGTDTQEETAYFLSLTTGSAKPVVLTGSMRPSTAISTDGPKNLYDAILVAAAPQSQGTGVVLSFNERIYDAKNVTKINTLDVNAFDSPNTGPIGKIYDGQVRYHSQPIAPGPKPFVDISKIAALPKVEIVSMYADASAIPFNALLNEKTDGIVIAGVGNGHYNQAVQEAILKAKSTKTLIVRSSRVVSGNTEMATEDEFNDVKMNTIAAIDHTPQKARILLMLALTLTKDREKIQELFRKY